MKEIITVEILCFTICWKWVSSQLDPAGGTWVKEKKKERDKIYGVT